MPRPAPPLTARTAEYWRSGADGVLRIARCGSCGVYLHPPRPRCPECHAADVSFVPVSGKGTVYSFTVNRYRWTPALEPPYVLAEIELPEQPGLRLVTALVGCAPEAVRIGMPVSVAFEPAAGEPDSATEPEKAAGPEQTAAPREPMEAENAAAPGGGSSSGPTVWIPVFRP